MGNKQTLSTPEVSQLCSETGFTPSEIKRIHKRFVALDTFQRGYVTVSDLMTVPEVDKNPLGDRICKVFSTSRGGHHGTTHEDEDDLDTEGGGSSVAAARNVVDFKEFVKALATFNNN